MAVDDSEMELVTFVNVSHTHTTGKDVAVRYRVAHHVKVMCNDWIGIFRSNELETGRPLAYQWAPVTARGKKPKVKEITFPADVFTALHHPTDTFQYVYVSMSGQKMGVSTRFSVKPSSDSGKTFQQSKFEEPASSASLFAVSDDEWDFGCEKDDSSPTSDFSDIVVLSTSPSKETFRSRTAGESRAYSDIVVLSDSSPENVLQSHKREDFHETTCNSSSAGFVITNLVAPLDEAEDTIRAKPPENDTFSTSPEIKQLTSSTGPQHRNKKNKAKCKSPPVSSPESVDVCQSKTVPLSTYLKQDIQNEYLRNRLKIVEVVDKPISSSIADGSKEKQEKNVRNKTLQKSLIEVLHTDNITLNSKSKGSNKPEEVLNKGRDDRKKYEFNMTTIDNGIKKVNGNKFRVLENLDTHFCISHVEEIDNRSIDDVRGKHTKQELKSHIANKKKKGKNSILKETFSDSLRIGQGKVYSVDCKFDNLINNTHAIEKGNVKGQCSKAINIQKSPTILTNKAFPESNIMGNVDCKIIVKKNDGVIREGSPAEASIKCLLDQMPVNDNESQHAFTKKRTENVKNKSRTATRKSIVDGLVAETVCKVCNATSEFSSGSKKNFSLPGQEFESIKEKYKPNEVSKRRKRAQKKLGKTYNLHNLFGEIPDLKEHGAERILSESFETKDDESEIDSKSLGDSSLEGFPILPANKSLHSLVLPVRQTPVAGTTDEPVKINDGNEEASVPEPSVLHTGNLHFSQDVLDLMNLIPRAKPCLEEKEFKEWQHDAVPLLEKGALSYFKAKYKAKHKSKSTDHKRHKGKKVSLTPSVLYNMVTGVRDPASKQKSQVREDSFNMTRRANLKNPDDITPALLAKAISSESAVILEQASPMVKSYAYIVRSSIAKKEETGNSLADSDAGKFESNDSKIVSQTQSKPTLPLVEESTPTPRAKHAFCIGTSECTTEADDLRNKIVKRVQKRILKLQKSKDVANRKRLISKARDMKALSTAFESRSNEGIRRSEPQQLIPERNVALPAWLTQFVETSERAKEQKTELLWPMPSSIGKKIDSNSPRIECGSVVPSLNFSKSLQPYWCVMMNKAVNVWRNEEQDVFKSDQTEVLSQKTHSTRAAFRDHAITYENKDTDRDESPLDENGTTLQWERNKVQTIASSKRRMLKAKRKHKLKGISKQFLDTVQANAEMSSLRCEIADYVSDMSSMKTEIKSLREALDNEEKRVARLHSTILELEEKYIAVQRLDSTKFEVRDNDGSSAKDNPVACEYPHKEVNTPEPPCKKRRVANIAISEPEMPRSSLVNDSVSKCSKQVDKGENCHHQPTNAKFKHFHGSSNHERYNSSLDLLEGAEGHFDSSHIHIPVLAACVNRDSAQLSDILCTTKGKHPMLSDGGDITPTKITPPQCRADIYRNYDSEEMGPSHGQYITCEASLENIRKNHINHWDSSPIDLSSKQINNQRPKTETEESRCSCRFCQNYYNTKCPCLGSRLNPSNYGEYGEHVDACRYTSTKCSPCVYSRTEIPFKYSSTKPTQTLNNHIRECSPKHMGAYAQSYSRPRQNRFTSHHEDKDSCCTCYCSLGSVLHIPPEKKKFNNFPDKGNEYNSFVQECCCKPLAHHLQERDSLSTTSSEHTGLIDNIGAFEHYKINPFCQNTPFGHVHSVHELDKDYCHETEKNISLPTKDQSQNNLGGKLPGIKDNYSYFNKTSDIKRHGYLEKTLSEAIHMSKQSYLTKTIGNMANQADICLQSNHGKTHNSRHFCCHVPSCNMFTPRLIKDQEAYQTQTR